MIGVSLGLAYLRRRPRANLLAMLAIAACLLPILVAAGLKAGYVDRMVGGLRADPRALAIGFRADETLGEAELAAIRALPGVAYVEPLPAWLSLSAVLGRADGSGALDVTLLPSSAGDPLLGDRAPPEETTIVAGEAAAGRLRLKEGDGVVLSRSVDSRPEVFEVTLTLAAIRPATHLPGNRLLVAPALAREIESFGRGFALPGRGLAGRDPAEERPAYANARIFAADLESVAPLIDALAVFDRGVSGDSGAVAFALALDRAARLLVLVFGGALAAGAMLSLWSTLDLGMLPQRRHLALFKLMGARGADVSAYVLTIALGIGCGGVVIAVGAFHAVAAGLDRLQPLADAADGPICDLSPASLLLGAALTLVVLAVLALAFARRLAGLSPAGALRDEI